MSLKSVNFGDLNIYLYDLQFLLNLCLLIHTYASAKKKKVFLSNADLFLVTITQSARAVEYTNYFFGYDTKQFNGEGPVILELWGMQSTPSLPLLVRSGST